MRIGRRLTWITLTALLAVSCSSNRTEDLPDPARETRSYRGHAIYGHEVRSFRPCGWDEPLWAIEPDNLLWTLHEELTSRQEPYPEIFAVVEARETPAPVDGFGADYPGALRIEAVLYAGLEGPDCQENWSAFDYRVYGNEPFWSVEASEHRLRLSRLGSEDRLWDEISAERTAAGARYITADPSAMRAELTVTREPCRDSMSGAYYGFSALMRIDEEDLRGCALQGRPDSIPGTDMQR